MTSATPQPGAASPRRQPPTLYRTVVDLALEGLDRHAITDAIGREKADHVRNYLTLARRRGDVPTSTSLARQGPTRSVLEINLGTAIVDDISLEAEERGLTPGDLVRRLLAAIVEADGYDRVLALAPRADA